LVVAVIRRRNYYSTTHILSAQKEANSQEKWKMICWELRECNEKNGFIKISSFFTRIHLYSSFYTPYIVIIQRDFGFRFFTHYIIMEWRMDVFIDGRDDDDDEDRDFWWMIKMRCIWQDKSPSSWSCHLHFPAYSDLLYGGLYSYHSSSTKPTRLAMQILCTRKMWFLQGRTFLSCFLSLWSQNQQAS
jgi:hypothetical protein